jgi:hypothetical protein
VLRTVQGKAGDAHHRHRIIWRQHVTGPLPGSPGLVGLTRDGLQLSSAKSRYRYDVSIEHLGLAATLRALARSLGTIPFTFRTRFFDRYGSTLPVSLLAKRNILRLLYVNFSSQ